MAKASRGGTNNGGGGGIAAAAASAQAAAPAPQAAPAGPRNYGTFTDADAAALRQLQDSAYNGSVTAAVKMYTSGQPNTPAANIDGQGHSLSQSMNYFLEQGVDLMKANAAQLNRQFGTSITPRALASMQYAYQYMHAGAHAIGKDVVLTKGAHIDILSNQFGIRNFRGMSEQQLSQKLVGATFKNEAYVSTSYDAKRSPFLDKNSPISGGREVIYRIHAKSETKVLFGLKSQAEIIIDRGTSFKVTGVRFSGATATPRGKGTMPQIIIDLETV